MHVQHRRRARHDDPLAPLISNHGQPVALGMSKPTSYKALREAEYSYRALRIVFFPLVHVQPLIVSFHSCILQHRRQSRHDNSLAPPIFNHGQPVALGMSKPASYKAAREAKYSYRALRAVFVSFVHVQLQIVSFHSGMYSTGGNQDMTTLWLLRF